jgi:hypothetical protein
MLNVKLKNFCVNHFLRRKWNFDARWRGTSPCEARSRAIKSFHRALSAHAIDPHRDAVFFEDSLNFFVVRSSIV